MSADVSSETLDEGKPRVTIKLEADSVNIGYSAYDALRVSTTLLRVFGLH
jgi:hypothetical protein